MYRQIQRVRASFSGSDEPMTDPHQPTSVWVTVPATIFYQVRHEDWKEIHYHLLEGFDISLHRTKETGRPKHMFARRPYLQIKARCWGKTKEEIADRVKGYISHYALER
jgi:hypothetical protein